MHCELSLPGLLPLCRTFEDFSSQGGTWSTVHNRFNQTQHRWQPTGCSRKQQDLVLDKQEIQQRVKRIVLLGDSMMARTAGPLVGKLEKALGDIGTCRKTKSGDRCGEATGILGLQAPQWKCENNTQCNGHLAASEGEGPLLYGSEHPGCRDCGGCDAAFFHCGDLRVDFIAVEWARDVELQTLKYTTTQQVVAVEHFSTDPPDMVVFNTGVHDIELFPQHGTKFYERNLRWYTQLLLAGNMTVVFVNIASIADDLVPEPYRHTTSNALIQQANEVSKQIMQELSLPYLDVYKISNHEYAQSLHVDAIHFQEEYNQEICHILVSQLYAVFGKA